MRPVLPAAGVDPPTMATGCTGDIGDAARTGDATAVGDPASTGVPPTDTQGSADTRGSAESWPGATPAADALDRVFAILCGVVRLSCGLVAAPTALAVRTPPVSTPLLAVVVVALTGWSVLFAVRSIRRGPQVPLVVTDLLLTGGACLFMARLVAPEVIPGEVSWLAVLASTTAIVAQFSMPARWSIPAGTLLAAAYAVGAHWAGNDQEATGHAVTLLVQSICAAALVYLTRRSSRAADQVFEEYRHSVRQAALARTVRAAQRRQNRDLHDTALSTLTVVGLGAVHRQSPWLRQRAAADLRVLSMLAAGHAAGDSPAGSSAGLAALDERLRHLLDQSPDLPVTASLRPCVVPTAVAEAIADSTAALLSNVARHAPGASAVLRLTEVAGTVVVEVIDNGPGFDPGAVPLHRYGLRESVRGRMAAHGGLARIESTPGHGTRVRLEWPGVR